MTAFLGELLLYNMTHYQDIARYLSIISLEYIPNNGIILQFCYLTQFYILNYRHLVLLLYKFFRYQINYILFDDEMK